MPIQSFEERTLNRLGALEQRFNDFVALDKPGSSRHTAGGVAFGGANGVLTGDASKFFWDNTNKRLGLGTASPSARLHIQSDLAETNTTADDLIRFNVAGGLFGRIYRDYNGSENYLGFDFFNVGNSAKTPIAFQEFGGRIGIGTAAPDLELDVQSASTAYTGVEITNIDNSTRRWGIAAASNSGTFAPAKAFMIRDISGGATLLTINTTGYTRLGDTTSASYRLELPNIASVAGQGRANSWVTYSSETRKKNIKAIDRKALRRKMRDFELVEFDWNDGAVTAHEIGAIAERVYGYAPELVTGDISDPATLGIKESKAGLIALALVLDVIADLEKSK